MNLQSPLLSEPGIMEIVDTHQHLWDLTRHPYSWCAGIDALNRSFVMSDYLAAVAGSKDVTVKASIHIEADVDDTHLEEETRWLLELAEDTSNPLEALVIKALPERDGFGEYLDRFKDSPWVKGVRRVLHTQDDALSTSTQFRQNIASLGERGLSFDLCVQAKQLPIALELIQACPQVNFILDHCGVPDIAGNGLSPWRDDISRVAEESNVVACKVSGLPAYAGPEWSTDDIRPYFNHVVSAFGNDRLIYGTDWPVCLLAGTMADWLNTAAELVSDWSAEKREQFLSGNAQRVYRLGE